MLLLMRMEASFNRIWHVANTRTGLVRFLSYWGILSLGVPMIGIAVIAASYDFGLDYMAPLRGSPVMEGVREAVPPVAMALTLTLLYYAVPSCRVRIHHALFGGILTTVLLTFAKEVFGWAVPWFQQEVIYGVFAAPAAVRDWAEPRLGADSRGSHMRAHPVPDPLGGRAGRRTSGGSSAQECWSCCTRHISPGIP